MKTPSLPLLAVAAATLWWSASLSAQSTLPMPANADLADGHHQVDLPFGVPGFRTQILIEGTALAPSAAVISGLRFRADRAAGAQAGTSIPNVTVTMSHCSLGMGNLGAGFAGNVTSAVTQVFSGTVSLPAQAEGNAGPQPWNVSIVFPAPYVFNSGQQNLLIDIVGNNAPGGVPNYYLDAMQGGGAATQFGRAGDNPSFDFLNLIASTGNSLDPMRIVPGGLIEYSSTLSFTHPPGLLMLGFQPMSTPLDLAPFGAPTHFVYVDPIAYVPHNWTQSFIGWYSTTTIGLPNDPSMVDLRIYAQSMLFDATANPAGILTSGAIETLVGDNLVQFPMQQVDASDPQAAFGTVLDFGFGSSSQFGAVPVQFEGAFF